MTPRTGEWIEQTTAPFREDLKRLDPEARKEIQIILNATYQRLRAHGRSGLFRPDTIHLRSGLTPSLYALRAGSALRVILTVEEDPIFDRAVSTLFRVVQRDQLDRAYRATARELYGRQIVASNGKS